MYKDVYVYEYDISICRFIYVHIYVNVYVCLQTNMYYIHNADEADVLHYDARTYVCIYMYYVYTCICIYVYTHPSVYRYIYIYVHINLYVYLNIDMYYIHNADEAGVLHYAARERNRVCDADYNVGLVPRHVRLHKVSCILAQPSVRRRL